MQLEHERRQLEHERQRLQEQEAARAHEQRILEMQMAYEAGCLDSYQAHVQTSAQAMPAELCPTGSSGVAAAAYSGRPRMALEAVQQGTPYGLPAPPPPSFNRLHSPLLSIPSRTMECEAIQVQQCTNACCLAGHAAVAPGIMPCCATSMVQQSAASTILRLPAPVTSNGQPFPQSAVVDEWPAAGQPVPAPPAQHAQQIQSLFRVTSGRLSDSDCAAPATAASPAQAACLQPVGQHHVRHGPASSQLSDAMLTPGRAPLPADPLQEPRWTRLTEWVNRAVGAQPAPEPAASVESAPDRITLQPTALPT